jgi:hypothetical protein
MATGEVHVPAGAKSVTVEATRIRRDGTREELGQIAYWHRNPIKRFLGRLRNWKGEG